VLVDALELKTIVKHNYFDALELRTIVKHSYFDAWELKAFVKHTFLILKPFYANLVWRGQGRKTKKKKHTSIPNLTKKLVFHESYVPVQSIRSFHL